MTAILSEISNHLSISALKDKFKDVYANVNDKIVKVQEALLNKSEKQEEKKLEKPEKPEEKKSESYIGSPLGSPPAPQTTKEKIIDFLNKVKDYFIIAIKIILKVGFYVLLASLVANDMIMYSPVIRAFFFVFTIFVTVTFPFYMVILTCYYLLKRGYDYYHDKLSSEIVKPPKSFPMFFAILPLTTTYPESPVARFFMWPFMYQKSDKPERIKKENDRLQVIMETYWKNLNTSFDYLDQIKTSEPFSRLYEINKEHLTVDTMHPVLKPDAVVEPSRPLPDVIGEKASTSNAKAPMPSEIEPVTIAIEKAAELYPEQPPEFQANLTKPSPVTAKSSNVTSIAPPPGYNNNSATSATSTTSAVPPGYNNNAAPSAALPATPLPSVIQPTPSSQTNQIVEVHPPSYNSKINGQKTPNSNPFLPKTI